MLGTHGGDVSVMMLYGDERDIQFGGKLCGETAGMEIRMQVVRDSLRLFTKPLQQGACGTLMFVARLRCIEVTHALADESLTPRRDAQRVLIPSAHRQYARYGMVQLDDVFNAVWWRHALG
jgi:hypothetical protein